VRLPTPEATSNLLPAEDAVYEVLAVRAVQLMERPPTGPAVRSGGMKLQRLDLWAGDGRQALLPQLLAAGLGKGNRAWRQRPQSLPLMASLRWRRLRIEPVLLCPDPVCALPTLLLIRPGSAARSAVCRRRLPQRGCPGRRQRLLITIQM